MPGACAGDGSRQPFLRRGGGVLRDVDRGVSHTRRSCRHRAESPLVTCGSRHVDSAPTLRRVDVAPGNARFRREPGLVVERIGESRDRVVLCTDDVEEVHVPGTVTEIAPYAFSGVRNVRRLYLSEGVRSVGIRGLAVGCRLDLLHVDLCGARLRRACRRGELPRTPIAAASR